VAEESKNEIQEKFRRALERKAVQQNLKDDNDGKAPKKGRAQKSKATSQIFRRKSGSA
jgi:hypothetical protein